MKLMQRLALLWPKLDGYHHDELRDFFERWTYSWENYSESMSRQAKDKVLQGLDEELTRRLNSLEDLYQDAVPSPSAPPMPELPPAIEPSNISPEARLYSWLVAVRGEINEIKAASGSSVAENGGVSPERTERILRDIDALLDELLGEYGQPSERQGAAKGGRGIDPQGERT